MEVSPGKYIPIAPGPLDEFRGAVCVLPFLQTLPPREEALEVLQRTRSEFVRLLGCGDIWTLRISEILGKLTDDQKFFST